MKTLHVILAALALVMAGPATADKGGKGKNPSAAEYGHKGDKDKGDKGRPKFNVSDRDRIVAYFHANPGARNQLPPGLAKKGKIPPGWQKKIGVGQKIPDDVWAWRVPLPHAVIGLPPPPLGVVHVRIHDRVLSVIEKTHEVLDDLGLPHPPTPRR